MILRLLIHVEVLRHYLYNGVFEVQGSIKLINALHHNMSLFRDIHI